MDIITEDKLKQIQELIKAKEDIELKIKKILNPDSKITLPKDFSLKDEVFKIINETNNGKGISKNDILKIINDKFPKYSIKGEQVASSLAYLKNEKKLIDNIKEENGNPVRSMYKINQS